ncbi:hypothetical protein BN1708_000482 [Verticillium longisporum]|uniref:Uncharacterized protein n=1 Tax=Verticillium longisporum TaxID=100787 RepID=A0A0G4LDT2_VERLO|nr:hypothetical protein BN1708_000482 [Verticillium longisporum]
MYIGMESSQLVSEHGELKLHIVTVPWEVKLEVEVEAEVEARGDSEGGGEDGDEDENRSKVGRRGVIEDDDLDRGDLPHEYPRWFLRGPDKGSHARIRVGGNGVPNAGRQAQRPKETSKQGRTGGRQVGQRTRCNG